MGEKVNAVRATVGVSPGIGIVKSWQGIVEIVLRGVVIFASLLMGGGGGACQSSVSEFPVTFVAVQGLTSAAGGWLILLTLIIIIYEALFIVSRFVNFTIITTHITIVIIIDFIFSFVMAVFIFCAAVALATYVPQWETLRGGDALVAAIIERVIAAAGFASAMSFITMLVFIALGVFMLLGGLILNWGPTKAKYTIPSGSSGAV